MGIIIQGSLEEVAVVLDPNHAQELDPTLDQDQNLDLDLLQMKDHTSEDVMAAEIAIGRAGIALNQNHDLHQGIVKRGDVTTMEKIVKEIRPNQDHVHEVKVELYPYRSNRVIFCQV